MYESRDIIRVIQTQVKKFSELRKKTFFNFSPTFAYKTTLIQKNVANSILSVVYTSTFIFRNLDIFEHNVYIVNTLNRIFEQDYLRKKRIVLFSLRA